MGIVEYLLFLFFGAIALVVVLVIWAAVSSSKEPKQHQKYRYYELPSFQEDNDGKNLGKALTNQAERRYEPHLQRKEPRPNNMNCDRYLFSGIYKETQRKRTKREAYVFFGENPLDVIKQMGYDEPIEFTYHEWYPMSDRQKEVLCDRTNGHYQNNLSVDDASGLLDQIVDGAPMPTKELFDYAEQMRIPASYYYSENRLDGTLLHDLKGRDNVAYRVYRLYCKKKSIRIKNLLDSEYKEVFYQFADRFPTQEELDQYVRDAWVIIDERIIKNIEKQILDYIEEKGII